MGARGCRRIVTVIGGCCAAVPGSTIRGASAPRSAARTPLASGTTKSGSALPGRSYLDSLPFYLRGGRRRSPIGADLFFASIIEVLRQWKEATARRFSQCSGDVVPFARHPHQHHRGLDASPAPGPWDGRELEEVASRRRESHSGSLLPESLMPTTGSARATPAGRVGLAPVAAFSARRP